MIGHKTSPSTSQVTASNLTGMTCHSTNHDEYFNAGSQSQSRGGTKGLVFFNEEEILRKCVGSRSVFPKSLGIIDKVFSLNDVSL